MPANTAKNKSSEREQKERDLIEALKAAWYLPDEDRKFWVDNIETLPDHTLGNVLAETVRTNSIMSDAINAALEKNPENTYLAEIKAKITSIKRGANRIEEGINIEQAEEKLEKTLKEI